MTVNPENVAQHLVSFGYSAKAGTITDKKTGQPQDVVFVNGLGSINAYLNLSEDPTKFGLRIFGNLQEGYAPVVLDGSGEVIRETVRQNGQSVTRAKRGEPLDADALKRKNNEISLAARKEISAAVLAAYMLEVGGGDLEKIREGFRLQKWQRTSNKLSADLGDTGEGEAGISAEFNTAATSQPEPEVPQAPAQTGRKVKRNQSTAPSM